MTVRVHFIEHAEIDPQGLSAITKKASNNLGRMVTFTNEAEFRSACAAVGDAMMSAATDIHLVVISTHGVEDTGTWLCMGAGNHPAAILNKLFSELPPQTVIFLSVCWGGYAGNVSRIRACSKASPPVVIGALVPLWADAVNGLQDDALEVLLNYGVDDVRLAQAVRTFNDSLRDDFGQDAARIVTRDGAMVPAQGKAGPAWSLLLRANGDVLDGPFTVEALSGQSATVSHGSDRWTMHVGWLRVSKKGGPVYVGERFTFKAKQDPSTGVLSVVGMPVLV